MQCTKIISILRKAYIDINTHIETIKKLWGYYDGLEMSRTGPLQVQNTGLIYNVTAVVFDEAMQIGSKYFEGNVFG